MTDLRTQGRWAGLSRGALAAVSHLPEILEGSEYREALTPMLVISRAYDGEGFVLSEPRT